MKVDSIWTDKAMAQFPQELAEYARSHQDSQPRRDPSLDGLTAYHSRITGDVLWEDKS